MTLFTSKNQAGGVERLLKVAQVRKVQKPGLF